MKKLFILFCCCFSVLFYANSYAKTLRLAVIDLGVMNIEHEKSIKFTKLFRTELIKLKHYDIVPYDDLEAVFHKRDTLSKQKLEQYECNFVPCAEKVARATNADYSIIGRLIKKNEKNIQGIVANIQVIGVVSRRVEYTVNFSFEGESDFSQAVPTVVKRLDMWFPKAGEKMETTEKRRKKLEEIVEEEYREYWKKNREKVKFTHKKGECPPGMILIPGGKFKSGSAKSDTDRYDDEKENADVYIDEYCIDKYEFPNKKGARPLVKQEWFGARDSCENMGKSLCSEDQWEKACKGPDNNAYPYGDDFNQDACNTPYVKDGKVLSDRKTQVAGKNDACKSGYGVHDMSGNVYEWTNDFYEGEFYYRIIRGGSWLDLKTKNSRCSTRNSEVPFIHDDTIGFRCCLN